jgi:hypothetical protein
MTHTEARLRKESEKRGIGEPEKKTAPRVSRLFAFNRIFFFSDSPIPCFSFLLHSRQRQFKCDDLFNAIIKGVNQA